MLASIKPIGLCLLVALVTTPAAAQVPVDPDTIPEGTIIEEGADVYSGPAIDGDRYYATSTTAMGITGDLFVQKDGLAFEYGQRMKITIVGMMKVTQPRLAQWLNVAPGSDVPLFEVAALDVPPSAQGFCSGLRFVAFNVHDDERLADTTVLRLLMFNSSDQNSISIDSMCSAYIYGQDASK